MANTGQYAKNWEDLTFSDNYMFCAVMEDEKLCTQMLETLLKIKVKELKRPVSEKMMQASYSSRGVRLDVYIQDSGRVFDLEMQTGNYDDLLMRARYYQGVMDIKETVHNTRYKDLKESYVIFICLEDPFNLSSPIYTKKSTFIETPNFSYNDKSHFIVYNASAYSKVKDKEVRAILKYIYENKAETSFTNQLNNSVNEAKTMPELKDGYMDLWNFVEDEKDASTAEGKAEGMAEGKAEGKLESQIASAENMLKDNLPFEKIAEYTGLSLERVEELAKKVVVKA